MNWFAATTNSPSTGDTKRRREMRLSRFTLRRRREARKGARPMRLSLASQESSRAWAMTGRPDRVRSRARVRAVRGSCGGAHGWLASRIVEAWFRYSERLVAAPGARPSMPWRAIPMAS